MVVSGQFCGSEMLTMVNSAVAGVLTETRMSPRSSRRLYAARRAATVETSALGQLAPSLVRKMGSVPLVALKRACTPAGVTVQASEETWQELQVRPLVPSSWKNGLEMSMPPVVVKVPRVPVASCVVSGFAILLPAEVLSESRASDRATSKARVSTRE